MKDYRHLVSQVEEITAVIKPYVLERFEREYNLFIEITGVNAIVTSVILSEIGPKVEAFQSQGSLESMVGVCPKSYESTGIKKSSYTTWIPGKVVTRPGNPLISLCFHLVMYKIHN